MKLNESKFKDIRKGKENLTEKNWKYKIDKDLAFKLRDILEDDYDTDYEALREVMKDIYDNIHRLIPDMFDEAECESAKEDLDILDTEEEEGFYDTDDEEYDFVDTVEDSWNYELSNLYDICDTFNIWIPIRTLDEAVSGSSHNYAIRTMAEDIDKQLSGAKVEIIDGYIIRVTGGQNSSDDAIRDAVYKAADKFGFVPEFSRSGNAIDCKFKQPVRMYASFNRKKSSKKYIKEDFVSDTRHDVYEAVYDIVANSLDNLALAVHASVPRYNPAWCADDIVVGSHRHIEDFVENIVDDLFYAAEDLDEDSVFEEVTDFLKNHPYDKDSDPEDVAAEVLSNLYDLDYETCDGEISHAAYNAAYDYLEGLDESVESNSSNKKLTEAPDANGYEYDDEIDADIDAKIANLNKERKSRKTIANNARKNGASANKVGTASKIVLTDDRRTPYSLSNIAFGFSEYLRKTKFPHISNIGHADAAKAVKEVISNSPRNAQQIARNLNNSGLGYTNWKGVEDSSSRAVLEVVDYYGNKYRLIVNYNNNSIDESMDDGEDQFCIVAITKDGKKVYYKEGKFVENKAEATVFDDLDEARSEWFDIDKSKFKRVFVPKYEATSESYDKDGNHETCEECGTLLTDAGECPKCDLGDEEVDDKMGEGLSNKVKKKAR